MKLANRQALIGAVIAAAVTIGAGGGTNLDARSSPAFPLLKHSPAVTIARAARVCADRALDIVLDVLGDAAGRLQQL